MTGPNGENRITVTLGAGADTVLTPDGAFKIPPELRPLTQCEYYVDYWPHDQFITALYPARHRPVSYRGFLHSNDTTKPLLGGARTHISSRFGRKEDAEQWLQTAMKANGDHCVGLVGQSLHYPEIFPHCPGPYNAVIGSRCPVCHKMVMVADAMAYGRKGE